MTMAGTKYQLMAWFGRFSIQKQETFIKLLILVLASVLAFCVRLFSVIRYESVIHEFDPYFNYRTTKHLTDKGFYDFHNWFDDQAWYPLGRIIGGTIYPGLMVTAASVFHFLNYFHISIEVRLVCVYLAPFFSSLTTIVTYHLASELWSTGAGLAAASFISIVPGYISRSVAGSYDNEAIAIFCMLLTYYLWIRSVKSGNIYWPSLCAISYFYMVSSWGGYVFLINLIPLHVLTLIICGRFSHRIYVAYSIFYALGTILSMQISFVGFQPVQTSEHMLSLGVFGLCQILSLIEYVRSRMPPDSFAILSKGFAIFVGSLFAAAIAVLTVSGKVAPWTGRFYSLLDPSYAKNNIPIIASVSEHQPTAWSSFFFDLQILTFLFPAGLYYCFTRMTDHNIFIIIYGFTSVYFAGVMVRLMLVLAPVMCILSGITISTSLMSYGKYLGRSSSSSDSKKLGVPRKGGVGGLPVSGFLDKRLQQNSANETIATIFFGMITLMLLSYSCHCIWATSEAYSSPSIVLSAKSHDGSRIIFDDFREAYWWLRMNTPPDAKIMSWWDYGYQITAMANRTVLVDNNTWNNTHISRVGQAMSSSEDHAYKIMRELDVDYVLVIFGGVIGYSGDDINKFLWMVRIGGSTPEGSHIKEKDYFTASGEYKIDSEASPTMLNSLMYKLSYYRFGQIYSERGQPTGYDRVRNAEIGSKDFELNVVEEAYTTEHWIVRIYKVKDLPNRG